MTIRQLKELEDFYNLEPFGEFREEIRHGKISALHANINRDPKSRHEPFSALDFMSFVGIEDEEERILTPEEIDAELDRIFVGK